GYVSTLARSARRAKTEPGNQLLITTQVNPAEVAQQAPPLADHLLQSAAGRDVLAVHAQVLSELLDARGEHRDLDFRRAGVALVGRVLGQNFGFCCGIEWHLVTSPLSGVGMAKR